MIKILVDISSATESEIEELNKLIPFGREKFHFDKNNIKVEFITKQDVEIANANMSMSKEHAEILMSNVSTHIFIKVDDEDSDKENT